MKRLLAKLSLNGLALSLITRLVEQCEHILLVSLHTRLIECVDTQHTTTDAASLLKEVDEIGAKNNEFFTIPYEATYKKDLAKVNLYDEVIINPENVVEGRKVK